MVSRREGEEDVDAYLIECKTGRTTVQSPGVKVARVTVGSKTKLLRPSEREMSRHSDPRFWATVDLGNTNTMH